MQKEYIGHNDTNGRKLYVGDKVEAITNGVKGKVVSFDYQEEERDGTITHTKRYRVNWSPDGWINDQFSDTSNVPDIYIRKIMKGK